jgi:hypothetical protein
MFAIWALQWVSLKVERSDCIWPLAAHLDSEIGTGFGSAIGWVAELGH